MPPAITSTHAGTISLAFPYSLSSNSPALCAFSFVMHGLDPCILDRRQRTISDGSAPDYLREGQHAHCAAAANSTQTSAITRSAQGATQLHVRRGGGFVWT